MEQKFFEDLEVGNISKTVGRTITEADIVNFAGLSGDYNPIHMDAEFSKDTPNKQRIAHGLLVWSVSSGLFTQSEMNMAIKKSVMALMEINLRFLRPVFIGDTIHLEVEVIEKKETSKKDRGIIIMNRSVYNQNKEEVQQGRVTVMLKRKG
jgi:acyl dehydratase